MTKKNTKPEAKSKKLGLKKETLRDLSAKGKGANVKGGRVAICGVYCTSPTCKDKT